MIHLDTSVLIDAFTGDRRSLPTLRRIVADSVRLGVSTLALYEWRRGPRREEELALEAALLGLDAVAAFGEHEARVASAVYHEVRRPRGREVDIAIAACALTWDATLWTLNPEDFRDIPALHLYRP